MADKPVWLEVGIVNLCFLLFGTIEATYLSLYAAGVFILLSMTGWAVAKRLAAQAKSGFSLHNALLLVGTSTVAFLTTSATVIIFEERFSEGAWTYLISIPILYVVFSYFRRRISAPTPEMDYLGHINSNLLAGFGFGQSAGGNPEIENGDQTLPRLVWRPDPVVNH